LLIHDIYLTGSSGFVGRNLIDYLGSQYTINKGNRNNPIVISESIVIHLAGKAHDLKKSLMPDEYYQVNTELTKKYFDAFLASNAKIFITLSSVKAVADKVESELNEDYIANPLTHYGKSKLLAEQYILSSKIPEWKRVYILRPCMIHGPGNKGNLNLLYKIVSKGVPWPLGAFANKRSFCSIDNLCFIINELIQNDQIPSGVYNIADDDAVSTVELVDLIADSIGKKAIIWNIPQFLIKTVSRLGDIVRLPLNTERLNKLTETYLVSNKKITSAINKPLPLTAKEGLIKTFNSFNTNVE
jgi:nucleoside-diphosphate-sugar epimerase